MGLVMGEVPSRRKRMWQEPFVATGLTSLPMHSGVLICVRKRIYQRL